MTDSATEFLTEGQQAGSRYCLAAPQRSPMGTAGAQHSMGGGAYGP